MFSPPPPPPPRRPHFPVKVSHDFAVNFDEDNPECAGELSKKHTRLHLQTVSHPHITAPSVSPVSALHGPLIIFLPLFPTHTHTRAQICGCTAGSISASQRQTLICICEMGFHALTLTYRCSLLGRPAYACTGPRTYGRHVNTKKVPGRGQKCFEAVRS